MKERKMKFGILCGDKKVMKVWTSQEHEKKQDLTDSPFS